MNEQMIRRANDQIEGYKRTSPKYRRARIEAARLQAKLNGADPSASAYWTYIADALS